MGRGNTHVRDVLRLECSIGDEIFSSSPRPTAGRDHPALRFDRVLHLQSCGSAVAIRGGKWIHGSLFTKGGLEPRCGLFLQIS